MPEIPYDPDTLFWPAGNKKPSKFSDGINAEKLQQAVDAAFDPPNAERILKTSAVLIVYNDTIVAEKYAGSISIGLQVIVERANPEKRLSGKIIEVVQAIDPQSRKFRITIAVSDTDLLPGTFVTVRIPVGERRALLVPNTALLKKGQLTGVYTVDEQDIITYRLVRVGKHLNDTIEILSGLKEGEEIIVEGIERAVDGGRLQRM